MSMCDMTMVDIWEGVLTNAARHLLCCTRGRRRRLTAFARHVRYPRRSLDSWRTRTAQKESHSRSDPRQAGRWCHPSIACSREDHQTVEGYRRSQKKEMRGRSKWIDAAVSSMCGTAPLWGGDDTYVDRCAISGGPRPAERLERTLHER